MKTIEWRLFLVFLVVGLSVRGDNPEFDGRPFELLTTESQAFPGTVLNLQIHDLIPTPAGAFLFAADTADVRGGPADFIFLWTGDHLEPVASVSTPELNGVGGFRYVGWTADQSLLFQPTGPDPGYPVFKWDEAGIEEFIPADQTGPDIRYIDGNVAYSFNAPASLSTESIFFGPAGSATEVVDRDRVPNLFNYLGFDGQHVVFSVIPAGSNSNQLEIQQRNPDGEIVTVFSSGDPIPPDDGIAYTTRGEDLQIHDGVVYLSLTGPGGRRGAGRINVHTILARIENQIPEIVLTTFDDVASVGDEEVTAFSLAHVDDGALTADLSLENGPSGLFQLREGLWNPVVLEEAEFDGIPAIRFNLFPSATANDPNLYLRVISGDVRAFPNRIFTNAPLELPDSASLRLSLSLDGQRGAPLVLTMAGPAGTRVRVYRSSDLGGWIPDGDPFVLSGAAEKRGYPIPGGPLFFQLREEPDSAGE